MKTMGNIIKELRISKGLTQEELGAIIGVKKAAIQKYESGAVENIKRSSIQKLSSYFNVSPSYLMGLIDDDSGKKDLRNYNKIIPIKTKKVPLLGKIACGEPIFAEESHGEYVSLDDGINADFALICEGDSMIGARIYDGDIVFIREQTMVDNGEIAAVIIENDVTLKRVYYYREDNKLILSPENTKYAPLVYVNEELNQIRILGKAVAFQSKL